MKQYELLVVLPGTMEESVVSAMIGNIKKIIEKNGAENIVTQDRGKSRLAYPIRHIRYGYFNLIRFVANGESIPKIQQEFALIPDLLRSLITSFDPTLRADTQKKLGRKEEGPMRTLASVFERFGGEIKKTENLKSGQDTDNVEKTSTISTSYTLEKKLYEEKQQETEIAQEPVNTENEQHTENNTKIDLDDISKKLDELLEDDLKQV